MNQYRCEPTEQGTRIFLVYEKQLYCLLQGWTHTSLSDPKNILYTISEDNPLYSHFQNQREKVLDEMLAALQNEGMAAWDERGYIRFIQSFRQKDGE